MWSKSLGDQRTSGGCKQLESIARLGLASYCPLKSHHTNDCTSGSFTFFKDKQYLANASVFVVVFVSAVVFALYGTLGFDTKAKDITHQCTSDGGGSTDHHNKGMVDFLRKELTQIGEQKALQDKKSLEDNLIIRQVYPYHLLIVSGKEFLCCEILKS